MKDRKGQHKILPYFLLLFLGTIGLIGCGGGGGSGDGGGSTSQPPAIVAALVGFASGSAPANLQSAEVTVADSFSGASISNASVNMNGVPLTYNVNSQSYVGNVVIATGGSVTLNVTLGNNTYTASGNQFASYPTISAPTLGEAFQASNAKTVTWSWSGGALSADAAYVLGVLDAASPNGALIWPSYNAIQSVPIGTNSFTIPANSLTTGNRLLIVGIATAIPIPNAAPGSGLVVSGFNYVPIIVSYQTNATLLSIIVATDDPDISISTMPKGAKQQLTAIGTYSDNSTHSLANLVTWTSSDVTKATVDGGLVSAVGVGSTIITATIGNISDSTLVNVVAGFMPAVKYPYSSANIFLGNTAIGDLNGDGRNDVAVIEEYGARILIYHQNADRTLGTPQVITTDLCLTGITIADVNNDGLADLIAGGNSLTSPTGGRLVVFRQDPATHSLHAPQVYALFSNWVGVLAVADLNGDGLLDIVTAGTGSGNNGGISFLFQGKNGELGPEITYNSFLIAGYGEMHVADMNNDGLNDIVIQSGEEQLAVIKQVSPGVFSTTPAVYNIPTCYWHSIKSFALGDLNGDGRIDMAVGDPGNYGCLNIYLQDANGTFPGPTMTIPKAVDQVRVADVDGDGLNDIIIFRGDGRVRIFLQSADHSFGKQIDYLLPTERIDQTMDQMLSVGDATGDGLPDIVTSWSNEGLFVLPRIP